MRLAVKTEASFQNNSSSYHRKHAWTTISINYIYTTKSNESKRYGQSHSANKASCKDTPTYQQMYRSLQASKGIRAKQRARRLSQRHILPPLVTIPRRRPSTRLHSGNSFNTARDWPFSQRPAVPGVQWPRQIPAGRAGGAPYKSSANRLEIRAATTKAGRGSPGGGIKFSPPYYTTQVDYTEGLWVLWSGAPLPRYAALRGIRATLRDAGGAADPGQFRRDTIFNCSRRGFRFRTIGRPARRIVVHILPAREFSDAAAVKNLFLVGQAFLRAVVLFWWTLWQS